LKSQSVEGVLDSATALQLNKCMWVLRQPTLFFHCVQDVQFERRDNLCRDLGLCFNFEH